MEDNTGFLEKLRFRLKTLEHKFQQYRHTTKETVIVETEYGKVKGVKRLTLYDEPYFGFEGIPYAQPPVGELRFKSPQRPIPWQDVKDCTNHKDKATQRNIILGSVEGSEDCLYLNVYTNNMNPENPRPVMIYIHGGGFSFGEATREWVGPDYFMQTDVVLVTIQYRLGVFGFLSLNSPDLNVPGNAGLKDQLMAIKWVKNNCSKFGGNPDCITIFGESAGAGSVHFMMLTEQTQGIFHRAILMSGNAIASWAINNDTKRAFTLAKLAGYKGEDDEKGVLKFLMSVKAKDLIRLEDKVLTLQERGNHTWFPFGVAVEPYATPDCVVPKQPREMLKTAWTNSIPIMMGYTSYEGLFMAGILQQSPFYIKTMDTCTSFLSQEVVDPDPSSEQNKENGLKIKNVYVTGKEPTVDNMLDLFSMFIIIFPLYRVALARLAYAAGAPTFLYRFDFDSELLINPYRIFRNGRGVKGVAHADDLTYLFTTTLAHRLPKDSREYRTIQRTVAIWTQFAKTGNPYDEKIPGMDTLTWEPIKKTDAIFQCLNISDDLKVVDQPEWEKIKKWETTFDAKKELLY